MQRVSSATIAALHVGFEMWVCRKARAVIVEWHAEQSQATYIFLYERWRWKMALLALACTKGGVVGTGSATKGIVGETWSFDSWELAAMPSP